MPRARDAIRVFGGRPGLDLARMQAGEASTTPAASTPLLERDRELASLEALVEGASEGAGRLAIVDGAAGIGKTRLLAEARRHAADAGFLVLSARGGELEREFAFGVVRQLFEPVVADAGLGGELLDGAASSARAVFGTADPGNGRNGDVSFAVLHGLYWLTVNLSAGCPLQLAVDDLHWCDHPSLRFLAYLARRLEGLQVLAVCGLRPAEPGVDTGLLRELAAEPVTVTLHPGALSAHSVAELVRARLGEPAHAAFTAACHRATGGNPLLLDELLKVLAADGVASVAENVGRIEQLGPRAASRAVLVRLARLDDDAAAVARALAVLGEGADLWTAAALAGVEEGRAARMLDELIRAEIVRAEPPLGFVHPLVGGAVYADVPTGERTLLHERAIALLAEAGAPGERVAAHMLAVPPRRDARVVETLRRAGADALGKGAAESAVAYLERALREPPPPERRCELLLELGRAEVATDGKAAALHLAEAHESLTEPTERATVAQLLSFTLLWLGSGEESAQLARRAASELPHDDRRRKELEAFEYASVLFGVGDPARFGELAAFRLPLDGGDVGDKALAAIASYAWTLAGRPADACAALALEALAGDELFGAHNDFLSLLPIVVLAAADRDEAMDAWERSLAAGYARGSNVSLAAIRLYRGWTLYRRGELDDAHADLEAALETGRHWGHGALGRIYRSAVRAPIDIERGDLDRARFVLDDFADLGAAARSVLGEAGGPALRAEAVRLWHLGKLELLVAEGRAEEALTTADAIATTFPQVLNPALGPWRSLKAQALDRLGRREEAIAVAEEELERARAWGAPWAVGRALRALGTLHRSAGLELLEEAVGTLEGSAARIEHAKALAALGSTLRLARKPSDARDPLRRALELADACGARPLAEHIRSELYAAGARPRTAALSGPASLTASERRVAERAAQGDANREIAQALFVTPKTVEVHLSSAYRKLGIKSRRELAAALAAAS